MKKFALVNVICAAAVGTTAVVPTVALAISEAIYAKIAKGIQDDVLSEFCELCNVPRDSYHTRKICDYLKNRFQEFGIPAENIHEDAYRSSWVPGITVPESESSGNLWVDIPANSPKMSNRKPFVLQAHMDMVWQTVPEYVGPDHPLPMLEDTKDGRIIHTVDYKTSLGADDGVGLALMLALAKSTKYKHGPLRFIITADEETGMSGAKYIGCRKKPETDEDFLKDRDPVFDNVKYLLNIDGEKEGEITTSTAGAVISYYNFAEPKEETKPIQNQLFFVKVDGLLGGHSGMSIGDGRLNALKVLTEVLHLIRFAGYKFRIIGLNTTTDVVNAIPDGAHIILALDHLPEYTTWNEEISRINDQIRAKYSAIEPDIKVHGDGITGKPDITTCYTYDQTELIIQLIETLYYGVWSWLSPGAIETSANIGPLTAGWVPNDVEGQTKYELKPFSLGVEARSCNNKHISAIDADYKRVYDETIGTLPPEDNPEYVPQNLYWGWAGDKDKHLFNTICDSYNRIGIKWNKIDAHAGLEISWFQYIEPSILMSAVGPTLTDVHTPDECFYVDTYASVINAAIRSIDKLQK
ncbi:MAG: M20/M25/M40 family metallo-hydrolase [Mycoplasma sp.]|nr:M20/M25/M40 family metallo-hydrolase [Candidatus Hennigella equi]